VREQTARPNRGSRRRPGISSNACTQIGEQPEKLNLAENRIPDHSLLKRANVWLGFANKGILHWPS
jgi:hypothetical protein